MMPAAGTPAARESAMATREGSSRPAWNISDRAGAVVDDQGIREGSFLDEFHARWRH